MPDKSWEDGFVARLVQGEPGKPAKGGLRAAGTCGPLIHFEHVAVQETGASLLDFGQVYPLETKLKVVEVFNACSTPVGLWIESKPSWVNVAWPEGDEDVLLVVGGSVLLRVLFTSDRQMQELDFEGTLVFASETQGQEKVCSKLLLRARTSLDDAWGEYLFGETGGRTEHDFGDCASLSGPAYRIQIRNIGRKPLEAALHSLPNWLRAERGDGTEIVSARLSIKEGEEQTFQLSPIPVEDHEGLNTASVQLKTNDVREEFRSATFRFRANLPSQPTVSFHPPEAVLVAAGQRACVALPMFNKGSVGAMVTAADGLPGNLSVQPVEVPAAGPRGPGSAEMQVWVTAASARAGSQEDFLPLKVDGQQTVLRVPIRHECVDVEISPELLDFGDVAAGDKPQRTIRVVSKERSGLIIEATTAPILSDALSVSVVNGEVHAVLHCGKLPQQSFSGPGITLRLPELDVLRTVAISYTPARTPEKLWLVCPKCGTAAEKGQNQCADPTCAASLAGAQEVTEKDVLRCPTCQTTYGKGQIFCMHDRGTLLPLDTEK